MAEVFVRGLEFYAFHGVSGAEQAIGHRFRAAVSVKLEPNAAVSDDVRETVDYGALAAFALKLSAESRFRTLEAFANAYCDAVLEAFPAVEEVDIEIEKVAPPLPVIAESVGIRMGKKRQQARPQVPDDIV
ncbi:MAG: dihydroneopterin aldolase [Fimbriimonadaceae bacterium]|nr:dihydroneopterin aldolase [Fimbriimonadaceae bacterium]QYK54849.1 MAG: dihydroneopterin aldolase [Fimbriimonadaceae bacterium]